jgi:hypothetical protein
MLGQYCVDHYERNDLVGFKAPRTSISRLRFEKSLPVLLLPYKAVS